MFLLDKRTCRNTIDVRKTPVLPARHLLLIRTFITVRGAPTAGGALRSFTHIGSRERRKLQNMAACFYSGMLLQRGSIAAELR